MNEKKKTLILLFVCFFVVALIVFSSMLEEGKSKKYLSDFYNNFKSTENKLVMIGRDNCSWCSLFKPILDSMSEHYDFEFLYVNTNELTNSTFNKLLNQINVDSEDFGTPYTIVVRDEKVIDSLGGYVNEPELLDFLIENGFVDEDEDTILDYINYDDYEKLLKSKDKEIVVISQTSCTYCIKSKPILSKISSEYDLDINVLEVNTIDEEDSEKFSKSLSYFEEENWGTPLMLIIKNGNVIADANGLLDYDGYISLFKDNGLIK